jgi:predicted dehydrogenase
MVKIGVVGCGYWGPKHIRVFSEIDNSNLSMVCDLDSQNHNPIP